MTKLTWRSPKLSTRTVTLAAMLIAIEVCLGKISVGSDSLYKIGLGFIGTALIGYFLGPWVGGCAMVINDLISNTIFSSGSTFFFGFTFSAFIAGVIAGIFLHQQPISWQRMLCYTFVQILISNVFFNTLWIFIMYLQTKTMGAWLALLLQRLPKEVISWPIQTLILLAILQALARMPLKSLE